MARHDDIDRNPDDHPYVYLLQDSLDFEWLADGLPAAIVAEILQVLLANALRKLIAPPRGALHVLQQTLDGTDDKGVADVLKPVLATQLLIKGCLKEAQALVATLETEDALTVKGWAEFIAGRHQAAIEHYQKALKLFKKRTRKRKTYFYDVPGLFFILALIKSGAPQQTQAAHTYARIAERRNPCGLQFAYATLANLIDARSGDAQAVEYLEYWQPTAALPQPFPDFIGALALYWTNRRKAARAKKMLQILHSRAVECNYDWIAAECAELLSRGSKPDPVLKQAAQQFWQQSGLRSMVDLVGLQEKWEHTLTALINFKQTGPTSTAEQKSKRLAWLLDIDETYQTWTIAPREQTLNAKGVWSKGRKIALKRLCHELDSFDYFTPQDRAVVAGINEIYERSWRGYPEIYYEYTPQALTALAGHPAVFREEAPTQRLEIVKGEPELQVRKLSGGKIKIAFANPVNTHNPIHLIEETPTRIKIIETSSDVLELATIIGKGVVAPARAKQQVLEAIDRVSTHLTVQSELAETISSAETVPAASHPVAHLLPFGQGLKLYLLVQPFANEGPTFRPGEGSKTVIAEIDGKQMQTTRDPAAEKKQALDVITDCPALQNLKGSGERPWEWLLQQPRDCLEMLLALEALKDRLTVKWPEGERIRIKQQVDLDRLFINVRKRSDWLEVSGELRLDKTLVLDMQQLMALIENTPDRFVQLADGQFLALTHTFRQRLDELHTYSQKAGTGRRFHPLAAFWLDDLSESIGGVKGDRQWQTHLKRLKSGRRLEPASPSTFRAELRDYQLEGFRWLVRMAHWGVGACLADDMGLGKTVQALAVMLTAAPNGPSLVVAPTSVALNWQAEAARFAPTLNFRHLTGRNRRELLARLAPFDVVIATYGLLQQAKTAELLASVAFQTIVLDEAQAIKNLATKRSQGAMKLNGAFKLITTGTPIENHLGELWNLFRFINPGLLGSLAEFKSNFIAPIENQRDPDAQRRLKRLIQPFILRRTKSQVLEELPPRTDITLQVSLNPKEIALYEALRQKAVEKLAGPDQPAGGNHLRILAEIMRLRRACCHSRLVLPDGDLPSAKLALFGDVVADLLANRHKALVFSQFVDHLAIIREYLDQKGIGYQYLDGRTPARKRQKRVTAFQSGQGDLFLISLKAGGLGLNLTAADYVIHMDPWWNPAVEDQASDRAHRIGQTRPVTVYRLVAQHTIEEKIVALHSKKRDLADSLLEGSDMSSKMSADELLRLIKEK